MLYRAISFSDGTPDIFIYRIVVEKKELNNRSTDLVRSLFINGNEEYLVYL